MLLLPYDWGFLSRILKLLGDFRMLFLPELRQFWREVELSPLSV